LVSFPSRSKRTVNNNISIGWKHLQIKKTCIISNYCLLISLHVLETNQESKVLLKQCITL
jgi:hypothetical protein